jgi:hypothetical protein
MVLVTSRPNSTVPVHLALMGPHLELPVKFFNPMVLALSQLGLPLVVAVVAEQSPRLPQEPV